MYQLDNAIVQATKESTMFLRLGGFSLMLCLLLLNLPATQSSDKPAELFAGMGAHSRQVTKHTEAQKYFDQGLTFLFAYNHDEARRSFQAAAKLDPQCAMAYWGIAISYGPHINKPIVKNGHDAEALAALKQAEERKAASTPADQMLISSLAPRFMANAPEDRTKLNAAYAASMKEAWSRFPQDADIGSLYAESIMNQRPWDLWQKNGEPHPGTPEVVATLEAVMKLNPNHPMALHLYIHAVEASPHPEKAVAPADRLRQLCPSVGHLVHMPSHIDVRTGRWQQAIEANERAIIADANYRRAVPKQDFQHLYMAHNQHMLAFAAMMSGQSKKALEAVRTMAAGVPMDWVVVPENAAIVDGFLAAPLEVMMRFGMWEAILKEPEPPAGFPIARGLYHHARGVAYAALQKTTEARAEQVLFKKAASATPKEARFGNNSAEALFAVADVQLEGEILYREGKITEAIQNLRAAVALEDQLGYDEPPGWIIPVRHALGAMLLKNNQAKEAEAVYRDDLVRWPRNGWSLFGLMKCLEAQNRDVEMTQIEVDWKAVWKHADVTLGASCKCLEK
jgi:tetratricopeptide (TPR) repeat protein